MTTGRINQVAIGVSKTVNQTRVRQVGPIRPHCHGKPPWREPGQTSTGPATILVLDRLHVPPSITRLYLYFQCCRQKRGQMTPLLALPSSREGRPRASECRQPSICSVKNTSRGTRHSRIVPTNQQGDQEHSFTAHTPNRPTSHTPTRSPLRGWSLRTQSSALNALDMTNKLLETVLNTLSLHT